MLSTCNGPSLRVAATELATPACWPVDALLLGALEAGVRADFLYRAEAAELELAFYESTAQARWSEGPPGPDLLDVCVQPRVGVLRRPDVARARSLFTEVAVGCLAARALRIPLTLQPTVELWSAPAVEPRRLGAS